MKHKMIIASSLLLLMLTGCDSQPVKPIYTTYKNAKVLKIKRAGCFRGCDPNADLKIGNNKISVKATDDYYPLMHKGNVVNVKVNRSLYVVGVKLSNEKDEK